MVDGSSLLLDLDGVVVESVQRLADGTRLVHVLTAPEWVGICPECGERSSRSKGWVQTGPRDVQVGPDRPVLRWRKRKWLCPSTVCARRVFTEAVAGIPARARVTPRPGSPKNCSASCFPAPTEVGFATRSMPPWTGSTDFARPARCPRSSASPAPSRPGRPRSSPRYRPACPTPAPRATTASSNTSAASPSDSATPTTNAAAYGGPAPANHGESHPTGTNATANCEEPKYVAIQRIALPRPDQ